MRYDFLREPISEAEPCGPDLDETFDDQYIQWTSEASGLVPERFFTPRMGGGVTVFDRGSINYPEQESRILELLKRTYDLRLLVLDARFQLLAGNLAGFGEALQGIEIIASTYWEHFHPLPFDGTDFVMRVNTLEALNDNALVIPALHTVPLITGRTQINYRNYLVATDAMTPYEGEEVMTRDFIGRMLSPPRESPESEPIRRQLIEARDIAAACLETLAAIRQAFIDQAGHVNAPKFEVRYSGAKGAEQITGLEPVLKAIIAFLNLHLGEAEAVGAEAGATGEGEAESAPASVAGLVGTHAAAASALGAVESYFLRMEPSSPVLILVHQARQLIGRPLTDALETLMPEPAMQATMRFDSGFRFNIDLGRMKLVTDDLLATAAGASEGWAAEGSGEYQSADEMPPESPYEEEATESPAEDAEPVEASAPSDGDTAGLGSESETGPPTSRPARTPSTVAPATPASFSAATRLEAGHLLGAVEAFFRQVEPSSPIPLLLIRARSYFGKDFSSILTEMMAPDPGSGSE